MYVTPCMSICYVDPSKGYCIGCGRTQQQINEWLTYADEERMRIMKDLGYGKRMGREERIRRYDKG